jgi:predicted nucleotidyltransferase
MKSIEIIKKELRTHRNILKKRYMVKDIGIFGSYARKEQRWKKSDLDILVEFDNGMSLLKFIEMENYLTDLLGVKVDLVMKSALKPRIRKRIGKEVIYIWKENIETTWKT